MSDQVLRADAVTYAYPGGSAVLDGVSMDLPAGSLTGIIGPNGSGKTTLLRVLAGLVAATNGIRRCSTANSCSRFRGPT